MVTHCTRCSIYFFKLQYLGPFRASPFESFAIIKNAMMNKPVYISSGCVWMYILVGSVPKSGIGGLKDMCICSFKECC